MKQSIAHIALVVRDYDEAIGFFTETLDFRLVEDTHQPDQDQRWVLLSPPGSTGTTIPLARASNVEQEAFIGNQSGGRVFLFLKTDDFWRDYNKMLAKGVTFVRKPRVDSYGTVAVFQDLYGNLWDLLEWNSEYSPQEYHCTGLIGRATNQADCRWLSNGLRTATSASANANSGAFRAPQ